jgi:hypothetical protein
MPSTSCVSNGVVARESGKSKDIGRKCNFIFIFNKQGGLTVQIIDYGYHLSIECNRDPEFEADLKRISNTAKWDREFGTYVVEKQVKDKAINLTRAYFGDVEYYSGGNVTKYKGM